MDDVLGLAVDWLGPMALIAMLASACGTLRASLKSDKLAEICLGTIFGLVSMLEMHAPLEPFDGLIIDLRNVPVALAGAFLGFRGLAMCLAIACAARLGIGGVGALSGVAAMMIAGFAGFIWSQWQRNKQVISWRDYGILCAMAATHQVAVLLLPTDLAWWFVTHASLPLLVLNSLCIVVVGLLLDRETRLLETKRVIDVAGRSILQTDFLPEAELCKRISLRRADVGPQAVSGVLAIRLHYIPWIVKLWGHEAVATTLATMRRRLEGVARNAETVGLTESGVMLLPLDLSEINESDRFLSRVERALISSSIVLGSDEWLSISVSLKATPFAEDQKITTFAYELPARTIRSNQTEVAAKQRPASPPAQPPKRVPGPLQSELFEKANILMERPDPLG